MADAGTPDPDLLCKREPGFGVTQAGGRDAAGGWSLVHHFSRPGVSSGARILSSGISKMDPSWRYRHGLRPTLRHLMILVLGVALMSSLVAPLARPGSSTADWLLILWLPLTPALLSVLILVFDRRGPAKFWLAGLIASLTLPAVVAWADGIAWWFDAWRTWAAPLAVLNALGLAILVRLVRWLPRRCPACGLRSLLPLGRRATGLRWCASCGYSRRGD